MTADRVLVQGLDGVVVTVAELEVPPAPGQDAREAIARGVPVRHEVVRIVPIAERLTGLRLGGPQGSGLILVGLLVAMVPQEVRGLRSAATTGPSARESGPSEAVGAPVRVADRRQAGPRRVDGPRVGARPAVVRDPRVRTIVTTAEAAPVATRVTVVASGKTAIRWASARCARGNSSRTCPMRWNRASSTRWLEPS